MAKKQKDYGRTALRDAEVAFHDKVDEVLAELTERRARAAAVEQANAAANRRAAEQYVSDLGPQLQNVSGLREPLERVAALETPMSRLAALGSVLDRPLLLAGIGLLALAAWGGVTFLAVRFAIISAARAEAKLEATG